MSQSAPRRKRGQPGAKPAIGQGLEPLEERRLLSAAPLTGGATTLNSAEMLYVEALFLDVLNRAASPGDLEYFLDRIDRGVSFQEVVGDFVHSAENVGNFVQDVYQQFLHRAAEPDAVTFWTSSLAGGLSESDFGAALLASGEYFALQGSSNAGFVAGLYLDVLGRAASVAESTFWEGRLAGGDSLFTVAAAFENSSEQRGLLIDAVYQDYLHRSVDPGALSFWQGILAAGGSPQHFRRELLLSLEKFPAGLPEVGGLSAQDVQTLLGRAAAASATDDAIIAIVDRGGHILGVRTEAAVDAIYAGRDAQLVFAIDGAVAKARTAAFFANDQAPLTSRTVRFISQSTITQREVESNPNDTDPNSTVRGPGFVAPIGLGGHFPPGVANTPPVDLFGIEHTNRDRGVSPGADRILGTADDETLASRFNADPSFIPAGQAIDAPESYGFVSGLLTAAQARGIATLPGGIPLFKNGKLVGGIGVFFPGPDGYATFEQGFVAGVNQSTRDRTNAPRVLEAEWIAFAAANPAISLGNCPAAPTALPMGRIDLVGIELEIFGPHPQAAGLPGGAAFLMQVGQIVGRGDPDSGSDRPIDAGADSIPGTGDEKFLGSGRAVPEGWIVLPHDSPTGEISGLDVQRIILQGINEANQVRAAIRLPTSSRTRMIFSVTDRNGEVLGLYRMPDATFFSLDVATAKARNVAYYSDPTAVLPIDLRDPLPGSPNLPAGVAYSNRSFRFLAEPRYPSGVDGSPAGPFSILFDPGINPANGENVGPSLPASLYTTVVGYDAFNPGTNFRDPANLKNQNGIVFFPGSAPLYKNGVLVGGFGVSGDGVDQDDVVTASGDDGYEVPPNVVRADDVFVRGVRLPYQKFLRNPHG